MLVIETLLADSSWESLFADLYLHRSVEGSILTVYQCHADTLVGGDGMVTCCDLANHVAVFQYAIAMTGYRLVV